MNRTSVFNFLESRRIRESIYDLKRFSGYFTSRTIKTGFPTSLALGMLMVSALQDISNPLTDTIRLSFLNFSGSSLHGITNIVPASFGNFLSGSRCIL